MMGNQLKADLNLKLPEFAHSESALAPNATSSALRGLRLETMAQGALEWVGYLQRGPCPAGTLPPCSRVYFSKSHCTTTQSYRNETTEVTELGPHTMRKRALKSGRKKKEWQSKADPKRPCTARYLPIGHRPLMRLTVIIVYHGERGRYHYYQCLQLLLRLQVGALIRAWNLPSEFEVCPCLIL